MHTLTQYSDIGVVRTRNEDSVLSVELTITTAEGKQTSVIVMLLCDGMGGLNAGDWASQKACSIVLETIENRRYSTVAALVRQLEASIYIINNLIVNYSNSQATKIGTTFTLLVMHDGIGHLRHLGDSRLYQIKPSTQTNEPHDVKVLSLDHSVVMRDVRNGVITLEEAFTKRNSSLLYMCLGVFPSQSLDVFKMDFTLEEGASYLIASDGFWHMTQENEYLALATHNLTLQGVADRVKSRNERDNISAILYTPY